MQDMKDALKDNKLVKVIMNFRPHMNFANMFGTLIGLGDAVLTNHT